MHKVAKPAPQFVVHVGYPDQYGDDAEVALTTVGGNHTVSDRPGFRVHTWAPMSRAAADDLAKDIRTTVRNAYRGMRVNVRPARRND